MSHIIIHDPANELLFEREIAPNEHAHLYFSVSAAKPVITLPKRGDEGVDLSSNNDCQDGPKLVDVKKRWGYARITMGITGVDRRWKYHRANFRLAEMLDGCYHYLIHNLNAKGQHDNLFGQIGRDFGCLPIVGDVEPRDADKAPGVINKQAFTVLLYDWLRRCEDTWEHKPLIYTNLPAWQMMTTEPAWAREYNFFVAQYNSKLNAIHPSWGKVVAWQYAVKPIPSINKERDIDHDVWLGDNAPPGARHNFAPRKNQDVINLFQSVTPDFIEWLTRAKLLNALGAARPAVYSGPDIEDLPGLTDAEKAALIAKL